MSEHGMLQGLRIVFVLGSMQLGGSEQQVLLYARYLKQEQNANIEIWGFGPPGRVSEICAQTGISWRSIAKPRITSRRFGILDLLRFTVTLRKTKPDIILPYTMPPNVACGLSWRLTGARMCVWNQRDEGKGIKPGRLLERLAVRLTPRFISNSSQGAEVVKKLGAPPEAVRVIHNGLILQPPQADRATWRARLGVNDEYLLVCMVANLSPYKDHATLLRAWQHFLAQYSGPARLLLAGRHDAAYLELKALAAELGIAEQVGFLGPVEDISGLLGAVDIGAYSSLSEGLPNAVIECMAAGLPMVASDIPGIREALGEDRDGEIQLASPGNPDGFATRLLLLADDPQQRSSLGKRNRQRAVEHFHPERLFAQTVEFLRQSLERP